MTKASVLCEKKLPVEKSKNFWVSKYTFFLAFIYCDNCLGPWPAKF